MGRLLLFIVVSFAMGSCVSGEDIAKDFFEETEKFIDQIGGIQGDIYDEVGENEEDVCSDPIFTRTEPLGLSQHAILPGYVWDCQMNNGDIVDTVFRAYMDGTYVGRSVSDYEIQASLYVWNVCHVGPRPPDRSGDWVFFYDNNYEYICIRDDGIPGVALCQQVIQSPDGYYVQSVGPMGVFQYGVLQETIDYYQLECILAQE